MQGPLPAFRAQDVFTMHFRLAGADLADYVSCSTTDRGRARERLDWVDALKGGFRVKTQDTRTLEGSLKEGGEQVDSANGLFKGAYSFAWRFEDGKGTNPEELLGAAHGSCQGVL
jgi:hypothetical protein